ncbi:alpha/beta fold hydrolase [Streptomyces sp. JNUCC 64]
MKHSPESMVPVIQRITKAVSGKRTTLVLHGSRVACSLALLAPGNQKWRGAGNLYLALTTLLLQSRHRYGSDGADQVAVQTQLATGLTRLSKSPSVKDALLWYLAIQANMSYSASGWVKTFGNKWRDGSALPGVMRTKTYGWEPAFRLIQRYPKTSKAVQHSVLAMECLFPVVYLAGGKMTRVMIGAAGSFHIANAFVMGLGRFATAFPSMHPVVAYTTAPRTLPAVAGRDDRLVKVALVLLAGAVTGSAVLATQRRAQVMEGWPTTREVTTRWGNVLTYDVGGTDQPDSPVLVFNHGLSSTAEHFSWVAERLSFDLGLPVLSYSRAGYGPSLRTREAPYTLEESVDDLEDLVNGALPPGRKVVLVGHSLGGELNRRLVARLGDRVSGVVYVDPTHPAELIRSKKQLKGSENFTETLRETARWTRLGFGALMSRPRWVDQLPDNYRRKVFAHYADARMWQAAVREWDVVREELMSFSGTLDPVTAPGLVIAAQMTVDNDPDQLLMYHDLVRTHETAGGHASLSVVERANHDSILTNPRFARSTADLIAAFVREHCASPAQTAPDAPAALVERDDVEEAGETK